MDNTARTIKEWAILSGTDPDTARRTISRRSGRTLGQTSVLTADEWEMWKPGKSGTNTRTPKAKSVLIPPAPAVQNVAPSVLIQEPQAIELPALETLRDWTVDALLIALSVGHAGLIWYELQATYGTYGFIGGGVVFGFIVAAVLLAADRTKNMTSTYALIFAFIIDLAAMWLHYDSFKGFGAPAHITIAVCVFLGGMSWGALFLFRHKKNN